MPDFLAQLVVLLFSSGTGFIVLVWTVPDIINRVLDYRLAVKREETRKAAINRGWTVKEVLELEGTDEPDEGEDEDEVPQVETKEEPRRVLLPMEQERRD